MQVGLSSNGFAMVRQQEVARRAKQRLLRERKDVQTAQDRSNPENSLSPEPVLPYDALQADQQCPAIPCALDDAFVERYLQATGEHHPLFTAAGGYAPPLITSMVRFPKASLGGRWPDGTIHLRQEIRLLRPLRRGEALTLSVHIGQKYIRKGRHYIELLTTTWDQEQHPVVQGSMLMLWAGATQFPEPTRTPQASRGHESASRETAPEGRTLEPITADITRAMMQTYGDVAGARSPLHLDEAYARQTRFGKNIAQGLLVLTLLSRLMTQTFAERWLAHGTLKARFLKPVFVDDRITARGVELAPRPTPAAQRVRCVVWCENQHGDRVIDGEATV
jgi:3-hydroxybutyryl-CoA dehydratase